MRIVSKETLVVCLAVTFGTLIGNAAIGLFGDFSNIEDTVSSQVLKLTPPSTNKQGGTGFTVVAPSGKTYTLTNAHICDVAEEGRLRAHLSDDRGNVIIRVVEKSGEDDLCLVEAVPTNEGLKIANEEPSSKEDVFAYGHPVLQALTITKGRLLERTLVQIVDKEAAKCDGPNRKIASGGGLFGFTSMCLIEYMARASSIPIYPGNSGSPIVNSNGRVVAVAFASLGMVPYGRLVPLAAIKKFLRGY